ncbi:Thiol:disulfide oxidoreductase related to ResA [Myxococcus hansupus]|uniref:Thiol:disulfide oxidoreductase related to ResA n=1 Tax=Pseudomyxococcus hansupus TaxID=1297742 RepID=A0A0H4WYD1_9BACT|nr:TlpA disulfide reductase family protein [Myxococcus hansupus]AKQ66365.1 Thiol:disulfide oxidoreductase related to ResA [Myxococcus hansupus]
MRTRTAWSLLWLLGLSPLTGACKREPPPAYVRLQGTAPALAEMPASRALLVVFWASWCPPCVEETPQLLALAKAPPKGLQIAVISHDETPQAVESFFQGPPPASLHLRLDLDQRVGGAFGVDQLPVSFLIVDGRLVARFSGPRGWDAREMRRLLEKLIRETPGPASGAPD